MADLIVGNTVTIARVALQINEAVKTVRRNKKECLEVQTTVARNTALLKLLEESTEITNNEVLSKTLEAVLKSLEEALNLVTECQQRNVIRRFFGAGGMAAELRRVKEEIGGRINEANLATNIHATALMTIHFQHDAPPPTSAAPAPTSLLVDAPAAHPPPATPFPPSSPREQAGANGVTRFSWSELKAATNDFSNENIIGRGLYSKIYKGVLCDGLVVAIKYFNVNDVVTETMMTMPLHEFSIGIKLQHKNVGKLLGYCIDVNMHIVEHGGRFVEVEHHKRSILVLGYVPNGSLHEIIEGTLHIDWASCFRIIQEIAQGLHYLHEQRVVHLDLKPNNILFDSDMNPVLIDFGLSLVLNHCDDEIFIEYISGTPGYIAPEVIQMGMISTKNDVFAFGIILLEIIKRVWLASEAGARLGQEEWDKVLQKPGRVQALLLDPTLHLDESQVREIKRCIKVGLRCRDLDWRKRPTMAEVFEMLNHMAS